MNRLPDDYQLRPATNADSAEVTALIFSVLRSYGLSPDPQGTDRDLADIEGFYGRPNHSLDVLVETRSRRIVGTVGLCPMDSTTVELRKMYLSPELRGCGLGKLLLDHAIGKARDLRFT
ncbi:MAG TPA: GNAT family N-acetyltransferase, partial [Roseimicrobium sp.]|nr:GNAT family N-acetyltransferase [Roseimicrobium sp.]